MTDIIEPDIELYGIYARESALADFLEIQAFHSPSMSEAQLSDYIEDSQWLGKLREHFTGPPTDLVNGSEAPDESKGNDDSDREDRAQEFANRVFALIEIRKSLLGDRYPFKLEEGKIVLSGPQHCAYNGLLAITLVHAYHLAGGPDPRKTFEECVHKAMGRRGFISRSIASEITAGRNIDDIVNELGDHLEIYPTPSAAWRQIYANDSGVDTVFQIRLGDKRPGRWVFIGQVTCGRSETWEKKITDASPDQWRKLLGMMCLPIRFLAVPHHISSDHLNFIVERRAATFLDRPRLCQWEHELLDEEKQLIDIVANTEIQAV